MNKHFAKLAAGVAGVAGSVSAFAQATDPATGLAAVQGLSGSSSGYGPVFYGLAAVTVGILIAVKWIKRARGAA